MICSLLVIFFIAHCHASLSINLADLQYNVSQCQINNMTLTNSFGRLLLTSDLLGQSLTLQIALNRSQSSCRLCAINSQYCNQSFGTALELTQTTSYNVRIMTLSGASNFTVTRIYKLLPTLPTLMLSVRTLFPFNVGLGPQTLCGSRVRLIVLLLLSSEVEHTERDFLVIANDPTSPRIACDPQAPASGLSCRLMQQFPFIEYQFQNCIVDRPQSHQNSVAPDATIHSILYWQTHREEWPFLLPSFCNESWSTLWDRAAPQNYLCSATTALYIKPLPWYETALEACTAWFNGRGQLDPILLQTLDTLENYCTARQSDHLHMEDSLLVNLTRQLRERHLPASEQECDGLETITSNVTLPYFAEHFYDWQLQLFQYMFSLDSMQPIKVILLFTLISVVVLVSLFALVVTLAHLYHRHVEYNTYGRI